MTRCPSSCKLLECNTSHSCNLIRIMTHPVRCMSVMMHVLGCLVLGCLGLHLPGVVTSCSTPMNNTGFPATITS